MTGGFTEVLETNTEKYVAHVGRVAAALKEVADEMAIPLTLDVNAVAFSIYKSSKDSFTGSARPVATSSPSVRSGSPERARELKLENEHDEAYLDVTSCRKVEGKFGARYQFLGTLPDGEEVVLYVGESPVERQCEYLGIQPSAFEGNAVQFSRAPNPKGKPFWNLKLVKKDGPKATPKKKTFEDPPATDDGFPF